MRHRMLYDELFNPKMTLNQWRQTIEKLLGRFGPDAVMFSDSGSNSTQLVVETIEEKEILK